MKKGVKIALCAVGVIVVCGAAAVAWQWNNLKAAGYMLTMDKETLDSRLEENRKVLDSAMEEYQLPTYTFSPEERAQLASGELDSDAAAARLLEPPAAEETAQPEESPAAQTQADAGETEADSYEEEYAEIRQLIAQMYVLQATYVGKLEAVVQSAIDEYMAGEHTDENRTKVVYSKFEELTALEKECDGKVEAVVSRLRELLKATGQDDTLAQEVERTYEEEKSLKKAYYLKEFQEG